MARISKVELIKLQKTLKTDAAIGEKFGISRQAVHQMRQKYGIDYNKGKNKERNEKIAALYKKGVAGTEIADQLDVSISQVYRIINLDKKPAKKGKKK
ncbi:MAG: helix-turn-helix domain-containing protein [Fibrobacteres bacterium]|nr:helix-turn-helix domain-containing protein [Fibrobacterota bacterium]